MESGEFRVQSLEGRFQSAECRVESLEFSLSKAKHPLPLRGGAGGGDALVPLAACNKVCYKEHNQKSGYTHHCDC